LPVEEIIWAAQAPGDKELLDGKLKTAEAVIRKLYAKSMALTNDNSQLRYENEELRAELAALVARPHSSHGSQHRNNGSRPQIRPPTGEVGTRGGATGSCRESATPAPPLMQDTQTDFHQYSSHPPTASNGEGEGAGWRDCDIGGEGDMRPHTARSASVPPEYLQPGWGGGTGTQGAIKGGGSTESTGGVGSGAMHDEIKALESALKASEKRERALRQELQNVKRLELLLWEGDHMKTVRSHEVVGKLRSRLESAKGLLKSVTDALQESKEKVVELETQMASANVMTKKRLRAYFAHRHQVIAAVKTLIEKVPSSGLRGKAPSSSEVTQARGRLLEDAHAQQQLVARICASVAAISELSASLVGERNELSSEATGSLNESDEDEGGPDPFSTSSLVRSAEVIALHLTPDAREELLALMRDIYQRFFLVKMEQDAVCETHEEVRTDADAAVRKLVMERAVLRGAVGDLLARLEQANKQRIAERHTASAHQRRARSSMQRQRREEVEEEIKRRQESERMAEVAEGEEEAFVANIRSQLEGPDAVAPDASDEVLLQAQVLLMCC